MTAPVTWALALIALVGCREKAPLPARQFDMGCFGPPGDCIDMINKGCEALGAKLDQQSLVVGPDPDWPCKHYWWNCR